MYYPIFLFYHFNIFHIFIYEFYNLAKYALNVFMYYVFKYIIILKTSVCSMPFTGSNGLCHGVLRGSRPLSGEFRERVTLWSGFLGAEATERRLQREGHSLLGVPRGRQSLGGGCRERSLPLGVLRGRQPMSPLTTKAKRVVIVDYNCQANCSLHVRHGWHHIFFFPFVVLLRSGSRKMVL